MEPTDQAIILELSGPNWWTVGAILLSALIGGFIALVSVAKHRIIVKKRAAQEYILLIWSPSLQDAEKKFREYLEGKKLLKILTATTVTEIEDQVKIALFLNHYELLAGSIKKNIIDESVCKSIIIDDVLFAYDKALPLIRELRRMKGDDEYYCELECLATRWQRDPLPIPSRNWIIASLLEIPRM
ncbi:MAG: DUF4760 domain-containing protein [Proteobacteria bacterium]|nr:DUF4760 domain-containing protein [Pseudomonadota bacterium]